MAAYGVLVRRITTAEINRVLREGGYMRWSYFVDEEADKTGIIAASATDFAAFDIDDAPEPRLHRFGAEKIADLLGTPDKRLLILEADGNELAAMVFNDPVMVEDDEFAENFDYAIAREWQRYLVGHGLQMRAAPQRSMLPKKLVFAAVLVLIAVFMVIALMNMRTAP